MNNPRPMFKPGDIVRHFKAERYPDDPTMYTYRIVGHGKHTETKEQLVVYTPLYDGGECGCKKGNFYFRPLEMFMSEVDRNKYPDIKQRYRFELFKETDKKARRSVSHVEALRQLFTEKPALAEVFVNELRREISELETKVADLELELKAALERC